MSMTMHMCQPAPVYMLVLSLLLHAPSEWFDDVRHGVKYKIHEAEPTSDVTTQMFINQLCAGEGAA